MILRVFAQTFRRARSKSANLAGIAPKVPPKTVKLGWRP